VGVGFLLSTADQAAECPFYLNLAPASGPLLPVTQAAGLEKATPAQIRAEWVNMNGQAANHLESYYQRFATMKVLQSDIDSILTKKIASFEQKARQTFGHWDDFAPSAQLALLDMIYNLGSLIAYPTLLRFATARDWTNSAAQCHRAGPGEQRNKDTRERFLAAAREQPFTPFPLHK
jgi:GH24 family phage-related lysozyme (muramidase)